MEEWKRRINYLTAHVDTVATQFALEHLRMYPLQQITEVVTQPLETIATRVTFMIDTKPGIGYTVIVDNAFSVGYKEGEGPRGLHDIMIAAGFSKEVASQVFTISRDELHVFSK